MPPKTRPFSLIAKKWCGSGIITPNSRAALARASPKLSTSSPFENYFSSKTVRSEIPKAAKNSLQQLHEIFNSGNPKATKSSLSDIVLIALDFENTQAMKVACTVETNCQAGIAILDTEYQATATRRALENPPVCYRYKSLRYKSFG
ncbi:hypothetical protein IG631_04590 [Alternaria alternata]|nr:hypothetical protein IG631_04590 [Alternaria alternata]